MKAAMKAVLKEAQALDIPALRKALHDLGPAVAAVQANPIPKCADPAGYYGKLLAKLRAAADNSGAAKGLGGLILAMAPLKGLNPLTAKLKAELHRTTGTKES